MILADIIILLVILSFGILGFKRGVFSQLILIVGTILIFVLSFKFMGVIGEMLMLRLPFFTFGGVFKDLIVLNIFIYQAIAFSLVLFVLSIIFGIVVKITGVIEKILKYTIILGIPSKILGFIVGLIEGYVVVFIGIFIISQISVASFLISDSKASNMILKNTFILSGVVNDTVDSVDSIYKLVKDFKDGENRTEFNYRALSIMLDKDVVERKTVVKLKDNGKISFDGLDKLLEE